MEHNRLLKSAIIPFEEYESLMRDYVQKQKLQKRVDKLEKWLKESEHRCPDDLYVGACDEALKILKGSDKE